MINSAVMSKTAKIGASEALEAPPTVWDKMSMTERLDTFQDIENNCPKKVPLTDEEIQEEANMVRYGNKNGKSGRNWEEDLKKVEEIRSRICLK